LAPREHGAIGQLALPLLVAHVMGITTVAAWLLTGAAVAGFFAHEPWLVLMGRRGARARREHARRATRRLAVLSAVAVGATAPALLLLAPLARLTLIGPALLAVLVAVVVYLDIERSLLGELLVAATLPAFAVPVAVAAEVELPAALTVWGVWTVCFASATWAVRAAIAGFKEGLGAAARVLPLVAPVFSLVAASASGALTPLQSVAALPMLAAAVVIASVAPHPSRLRTVGWWLVATSGATAALLCV
jgi:hypothetical protein